MCFNRVDKCDSNLLGSLLRERERERGEKDITRIFFSRASSVFELVPLRACWPAFLSALGEPTLSQWSIALFIHLFFLSVPHAKRENVFLYFCFVLNLLEL